MKVVKEFANAKINLFLDVIGRREDGFHDIKTLMHSVSLSDVITVSCSSASETEIGISVSGNRFVPSDGKNLAAKAAALYLGRANIKAKVNITLVKRIPVAAGLAGGSSDAAAVLRAMNKLYGRMFSQKALYSMAEELGSDVPYCLYGKTALCEGRGEKITKLPDTLKLYCVIAVANENMSTPAAYSALDRIYSNFDGSIKTFGEEKYKLLEESLKEGKLTREGLYNIFEDAVFPICKRAYFLKERLLELGARASMMSGSGPSVFGIFESLEDAKAACAVLRSERVTAYYAISV